jgi:hypothetical protein
LSVTETLLGDASEEPSVPVTAAAPVALSPTVTGTKTGVSTVPAGRLLPVQVQFTVCPELVHDQSVPVAEPRASSLGNVALKVGAVVSLPPSAETSPVAV